MSPASGAQSGSGSKKGLAALIRAISTGNTDALEKFIELVETDLKRYIRYKGPNLTENEIEAVFYSTLFRVYKRAEIFQGKSDHTPDVFRDQIAWSWTRTIARNQTYSWLRTLQRENSYSTSETDLPNPGSEDDFFDSPLDQVEIGVIVVDVSSFSATDLWNPEDILISNQGIEEFIEKLSGSELNILRLLSAGWKQSEIAVLLDLTRPRISQIVSDLRRKANEFFED